MSARAEVYSCKSEPSYKSVFVQFFPVVQICHEIYAKAGHVTFSKHVI